MTGLETTHRIHTDTAVAGLEIAHLVHSKINH